MAIKRNIVSGITRSVARPITVQLGAKLNYLWMDNPYFSVPAKVYLIKDESTTIYGDSLINVPISNNLSVTYMCDIGSQSGNNYSVTPTVQGSHVLSIAFKIREKTFLETSINLEIIEAVPATAVKLLMVGDSLVANGNAYISSGIDLAMTPAITYIGSKGTTIKHEGNSGYSFARYLSDPASPLLNSGVLDIANYFNSNALDTPDFVHIRLGVNDMFRYCDTTTNPEGITDAEMNQVVADAKTIIDGFLSYDANLKVIIGLPTISENTGAGWDNNYSATPEYNQDLYILNIHKMWVRFISEFDSGAYNSRVMMSNEAIFLDRDGGYPKENGVHSNGVHPNQIGYEQLGKGIALSLNRMMLGDNVTVNGDFANWTDDNPDNWVVGAETGTDYVTWDNGARIFSNGGAFYMEQTVLENGATYRFDINITQVIKGEIRVKYSSLESRIFNSAIKDVWYNITDGTILQIARRSSSTDTDLTVSYITAQKLLY